MVDMSFSQETLENNTDNIWHHHESEIRLLYQNKSLEEVKSIMDAKPGFPKIAQVSLIKKTWHEKLGKSGIRKNTKNEEWRKISRYCVHHRLEDPSRERGDKKLKRTKKKTEVIIRGRKFDWDQAWKNMKRAGAIVGPQVDPPSPLPEGITVRTPPTTPSSPTPRTSLNTLQPQHESTTAKQVQNPSPSFECGLIRKGDTNLDDGVILIQQSRRLEPAPSNPLQSNDCDLADCLRAQMLVFLPGLPVWKLSNTLAEMADLDLPSPKLPWGPRYGTAAPLTPHTTSVEAAILSTSKESVFHLSDLFSSLTITHNSSALATYNTRHRAYLLVSMAIYLLSNNLVALGIFRNLPLVHVSFFQTLDSAFTEMPATHIQALLHSRLASVRGAFEALLNISGESRQRTTFKSLIDVGTSNNWLAISTNGHKYLIYAVSMDLDEVVQKLLESGCRQDTRPRVSDISIRHGRTAIFGALRRRKIQCAQLLLEYCDVNNLHNFPSCSSKIFIMFIEDVSQRKQTHDLDEMLDQGIKLFLDAGADIKQLLRYEITYLGNQRWTVLDYLFCIHPRLFDKFAPNWSPSEASEPTRAGILTSLKFGRNILAEHCNRLAQNVGWERLYEYLERLVAEQFEGHYRRPEGPHRGVDLETVHTLVDFGVSMGRVLNRGPHLLHLACIGREIDMEVIRYLLDNGAIVDDDALRCAVRRKNTDALELLIQKTTNFPRQGKFAVVEAATANNFAAVKILLDAGVDINTELRGNRSLLFEIIARWASSFEDLKNMIDFLVQRGAHFRLSAKRPRLSDLMEMVLENQTLGKRRYDEGVLSDLVHYIIDKGCVLSDTNAPSAMLLDACGFKGDFRGNCCDPERMEIFEFLFKNGARLRPGAPLAAWIGIGGGAELVREMLRGDVDINAYQHHTRQSARTALQAAAGQCSEELVALLLQKGADVNSPARGGRGRTALQAVCEYGPQSPAEKAQQMSIINLLLAHGANVNAAPARCWGRTALQEAALHGNLEVLMLLLSCDPPADVNMPPCEDPTPGDGYKIALDLAAGAGRLDTVKLLLNNNALSGYPGVTGYDGAIRAAENRGHLAVADLIREHAATVLSSNTWHKNLSRPQRDWREYRYDDYSDGYTTPSVNYYDGEDAEVEDSETSESGDEEKTPVAQVQIQLEVVEQPGLEHMAPEPGFVWDMEVDESLDFDTGFE